MDRMDKSYQVNLGDLKPSMIDHQTQMTPPLSPLKNVRLDQIDLTDEEEKEEVSKVSIGTETEDRQKPVQAATTQTGSEADAEEAEEVKEELDESGSSEEGGMKLNAVSIPIVKENIRRALVRDGKSGVDTELNDEQCLILLQGMKKMDDDFKSELKNLTNEEVTKSELFYLIKNFSTLSRKERKRLEFLIISNLNKTANRKGESSPETLETEGGLEPEKIIKIQNASLDSYLESLLDEKENSNARMKGESGRKI
jgi:hypothetical protein